MSDLIKREDAIKAVSISCGTCLARDTEDCEKCSVPKLRELINAIPSADRPQGWIPCSERLPREYRTVLVTWEYAGKFYTATAFRGTKNAVTYWASDGQPHYTPLNVVAWMPLPEPWKGADDE